MPFDETMPRPTQSHEKLWIQFHLPQLANRYEFDHALLVLNLTDMHYAEGDRFCWNIDNLLMDFHQRMHHLGVTTVDLLSKLQAYTKTLAAFSDAPDQKIQFSHRPRQQRPFF